MAMVATVLALMAISQAWPLRRIIDLFIDFGNIMHRITNPLIFGLIYVTAVIPTAVVLKLLGKDILQLRYDHSITTYWRRCAPKNWRGSFHNQY